MQVLFGLHGHDAARIAQDRIRTHPNLYANLYSETAVQKIQQNLASSTDFRIRSLPCWGYGIRYSYGMFKQQIECFCSGWWLLLPGGTSISLSGTGARWSSQTYGLVLASSSTSARTHWVERLRLAGDGCPFEIPRPDVTYPIRFYGHLEAQQGPTTEC